MPRLDTIILRLAGLTVDPLARPGRAMATELAALAALAGEVDAQRGPLEDRLFELVQRAESCKELRRSALEVKRAVHNRRAPKLKPGRIDAVMDALCDPGRQALARWLTDFAELQARKLAWDEAMASAVNAGLRGAIIEALADDGFDRALRSTAWPLFVQLQPLRRADDPAPLTTAERKVLAYISRAAWKTSPLSTFLHTGRLVLRPPQPGAPAALDIGQRYATTHVNPALLDELQRLRPLVMDPDAVVRRNPRAVVTPGGAIRYLKATYTPANAGNWRVDRKSEIALGGPITQALFSVPAEGQALRGFLATLEANGVGGRESEAVVRILAREGLVSLSGDAAALEAQLAPLQAALVEDAARDNPRWLDPDRVDEVLASTRASIGATGATLGASGSRFEHGVASLTGNVLDPPLARCLAELESVLPDYLVVNPAYLALVRAWERASEGAADIPLLRLLEAYAAPSPAPGEPAAGVEAAALLAAGHRAPVTAYFQLACAEAGYRLVLNQAQTFSLSQSLRALPAGAAERDALLRTYGDWLQALHGDAEPVELPLCNRCNGLQAHPRITRAVLDWGNETGHADPRIAIEDVQVGFDARALRFRLTDRNSGRELSLVYLGGILPQTIWGDAYPLTLINNPIQVALPTLLDAELGLAGTDGVAHAPRVERGSIVLRRALWRVPSRDLLRLLEAAPSEAFLALRDYFEAHAIPLNVFMRPSAGGDLARYYTRKTFRKPMYFDGGNPALYPSLQRLAGLAEHVVLVEALPGPEEQWLERVANQRRVSEFQVEFALGGDPVAATA